MSLLRGMGVVLGGSVGAVSSWLFVGWLQQEPLIVPKTPYNASRAVQFAKLAGAAYCSRAALEAWECGPKCIAGVEKNVTVCLGATTLAYVARWEGQALVAFQGTQKTSAMVQDLRFAKSGVQAFCDKCHVHTGFLVEWKSLSQCVSLALTGMGSPSIRVTGHSLGAAVASLAMLDLIAQGWFVSEAYTFGMPRVGDLAFSQHFAAKSNVNISAFFRVTYHMDPVPHLPPQAFGFFHLIPEVFYNSNFVTYRECSYGESTQCARQFSNLPIDVLHTDDHLVYMGQDTGSKGCEGPQEDRMPADLDIVV